MTVPSLTAVLTASDSDTAARTLRSRGMRLPAARRLVRSEEHTSELQSQSNLVCRLLLEKKKNIEHTNSLANKKHTTKRLSTQNQHHKLTLTPPEPAYQMVSNTDETHHAHPTSR